MRKPILYINACIRQESRTKRLAEKLLLKLGESYEEIRLDEAVFPVVNEEYLCKRDQLISKGDFKNTDLDVHRFVHGAADKLMILTNAVPLAGFGAGNRHANQTAVIAG